jgi:hypothetical protein
MEGQLHAPAALYPGKNASAHWTGMYVGLTAGMKTNLHILQKTANFLTSLQLLFRARGDWVFNNAVNC